MKRKTKFKTGKRSTCEWCGGSVAHNIGTESDIYCHTCKTNFTKEDQDVYIWELLTGFDNIVFPSNKVG